MRLAALILLIAAPATAQTTNCMTTAPGMVTCNTIQPYVAPSSQSSQGLDQAQKALQSTIGQGSNNLQSVECHAMAKRAADAGNFTAAADILKTCR